MELNGFNHSLNAVQMGDRDKESVQEALRTATEWLDRHGQGATLEEVGDQLTGKFSISHVKETTSNSICRSQVCRRPDNGKAVRRF
jgi:hypothetical protein